MYLNSSIIFNILRYLKSIPLYNTFTFWSYDTAFYSHATKLIFSENLRGSEYSFLPHELGGLRAPRPKEAKSNAFQAAVSHSRQYSTRSTLARGQWHLCRAMGGLCSTACRQTRAGEKKNEWIAPTRSPSRAVNEISTC